MNKKISVGILVIIVLSVSSFIFILKNYSFNTEQEISDCESIGGNWAKGTCLNIQNIDSLKCKSLKTLSIKDMCYRVIALAENNSEYCFEMVDNFDKGSCLGHIAGTKNDISICGNVDETHVGEICYSWMASTREDFKICEYIKTQSTRDWCYGLGSDEAKPKICEKIIDQEKRDSCYYTSGVSGAGCKVCKRIATKYWKDLCEKNLHCDSPVKTIEDCNAITDESEKHLCYRSVAQWNEDESICFKITDNFQKDMCIIDVIHEINRYDQVDDSLCQYVSDVRKEWCYKAVG